MTDLCIVQGASKNLNLMEWDKLWTINKKIIDPVCPRHTAVIADRRVLLTLTDGPEKSFVRIIPRHKKYEAAGNKATTYTKRIWIDYADAESISAGEEVTLMDWGNAIVKEVEKDQDGNVTGLSGVLHLEGSVKTTKLKLTWLPELDELVSLTLMEFDYLITKKKVCVCLLLVSVIKKHEGIYIIFEYFQEQFMCPYSFFGNSQSKFENKINSEIDLMSFF
jgi:glutamyl-tRNA synthetase